MKSTTFEKSQLLQELSVNQRGFVLAFVNQMQAEISSIRVGTQAIDVTRKSFKRNVAQGVTKFLSASAPMVDIGSWYESAGAFSEALTEVSEESKSEKCLVSLIIMEDSRLLATILQVAYIISIMYEVAINEMQIEDVIQFAVTACLRVAKYLVDKDLEFNLSNIIKAVQLGSSGRWQECGRNNRLKKNPQDPNKIETFEGLIRRSQPELLEGMRYSPKVETGHSYQLPKRRQKVRDKIIDKAGVKYSGQLGILKYDRHIASIAFCGYIKDLNLVPFEPKNLGSEAKGRWEQQRQEYWQKRQSVFVNQTLIEAYEKAFQANDHLSFTDWLKTKFKSTKSLLPIVADELTNLTLKGNYTHTVFLMKITHCTFPKLSKVCFLNAQLDDCTFKDGADEVEFMFTHINNSTLKNAFKLITFIHSEFSESDLTAASIDLTAPGCGFDRATFEKYANPTETVKKQLETKLKCLENRINEQQKILLKRRGSITKIIQNLRCEIQETKKTHADNHTDASNRFRTVEESIIKLAQSINHYEFLLQSIQHNIRTHDSSINSLTESHTKLLTSVDMQQLQTRAMSSRSRSNSRGQIVLESHLDSLRERLQQQAEKNARALAAMNRKIQELRVKSVPMTQSWDVPICKPLVLRSQLVRQVEEKIKNHNSVLIHGIPGCGKSYLARMVVEKYQLVVWLDGSTEESFLNNLAALVHAHYHNLNHFVDRRLYLGKFTQLINSLNNVIVVFDNLQSMSGKEILPKVILDAIKNLSCPIILTSCEANLHRHRVDVGELTLAESIGLLKQVDELDLSAQDQQEIHSTLHGHPLAITNVAAIIKETGKSWSMLKKDLQNRPGVVIGRNVNIDGTQKVSVVGIVFTGLKQLITLKKPKENDDFLSLEPTLPATQQNKITVHLLLVLAFLNAAEIPRNILYHFVRASGLINTPDLTPDIISSVDNGIGQLKNFSFIRFVKKGSDRNANLQIPGIMQSTLHVLYQFKKYPQDFALVPYFLAAILGAIGLAYREHLQKRVSVDSIFADERYLYVRQYEQLIKHLDKLRYADKFFSPQNNSKEIEDKSTKQTINPNSLDYSHATQYLEMLFHVATFKYEQGDLVASAKYFVRLWQYREFLLNPITTESIDFYSEIALAYVKTLMALHKYCVEQNAERVLTENFTRLIFQELVSIGLLKLNKISNSPANKKYQNQFERAAISISVAIGFALIKLKKLPLQSKAKSGVVDFVEKLQKLAEQIQLLTNRNIVTLANLENKWHRIKDLSEKFKYLQKFQTEAEQKEKTDQIYFCRFKHLEALYHYQLEIESPDEYYSLDSTRIKSLKLTLTQNLRQLIAVFERSGFDYDALVLIDRMFSDIATLYFCYDNKSEFEIYQWRATLYNKIATENPELDMQVFLKRATNDLRTTNLSLTHLGDSNHSLPSMSASSSSPSLSRSSISTWSSSPISSVRVEDESDHQEPGTPLATTPR